MAQPHTHRTQRRPATVHLGDASLPPATPLPFVDAGLGNSSYLLDIGDGRALVVDPSRHPGEYLRAAERRRLRVAFALETHLHADFVSGARELGALGASVVAPGAAGHAFGVRGIGDGDEIDLGGLTLRAMATPGHTPEHLSYLLLDGATPVALFSGGSLLVDGVARTDLIAPDQTEVLARQLWRGLQQRILSLPDDLPVYPTHGAGSFCSAPGGSERTTTIGRERAANPLLASPDEDTFVRRLAAGLGSYPPYFLRLREVNRRGPALFGSDEPTMPRVAVEHVARAREGGAWLVDVRSIDSFAGAHVPGSVSITLREQFATWLGWVVPADAPLIFVLDDHQDRAELLRQCRNIGYDNVVGELDGGIAAWQDAALPTEVTPLVPLSGLEGRILDVRQAAEFGSGHLPGAFHVELGSLTAADVPEEPLAVMCGHGERAMTAASLLARAGRRDVKVLAGGPNDWVSGGGRLES